ncbi:MAG: CoA transferase [Actinomycetota bacterium]
MSGGAGPLEGLRVVDSTDGRGELCGRLLADLGADVILVEPPGGSSLRHRHPLTPGGESLGFAWRNANKRGLVLDLDDGADRQHFEALLVHADVWIESADPGHGPGVHAAMAANRRLIVASVTGFGQTGPYVDHPVNDDVLEAAGAAMFKAGIPEKPPLLPPTTMATDLTGVVAAVATTLALHQRDATGRGQHLDVAVMTAAAAAADWSYANASYSALDGRVYNEIRAGGGFMYPIFRCIDGYIRMVILAPRQWMALYDWMGRPEAFADEDFWSQVGNRIMNADVLNPQYESFFADKRMLDICTEAQRRGIVATPLLTPSEVLVDSHMTARGTFVDDEIAPGVAARTPSGFLEVDGRRQGFRHRAPRLAEHTGASFEAEPFATVHSDRPGTTPLAGIRVLDFGIGGVGVEASRLLGEYGADVIKVETRTYPDFIRLVALSDISPSFTSSSRSKRSLGLNVKTERGLELVRQLIADSDVLIENSATGTLAAMGLGWEDVAAINPGLVMVSSQLVGSRGPNAHWTGYGPTTQTYGGLLHLWDYADHDPPATNQTIYPDHLAGRLCALAAISGLLARARTGQGSHSEIAQVEAVVNMLSEHLMRESLESGSAQPAGNRSPEHAPRGPYPCVGEQQWVVVSVQTDDQWAGLVRALGAPDWATDPSLSTALGRLAAADAIDEHLVAWTSSRDRDEVAAILRADGVPCEPMRNGNDLLDDPHLVARGWTIQFDQPGVGPIGLEGPAWLSEEMGGPITYPAPLLGEHTREIAAEVLGLDEHTIDEMLAAGVLEVGLTAEA